MNATSATAPRTRASALIPKEHGAYVMLGVVLASSLFAGAQSWSRVGLGFGAVALFLAHEPLAILLGARGERRWERDHRAARLALFVEVLVGSALIWGALSELPLEVAAATLAPVGLGVVVLTRWLGGDERSASVELMSDLAMSAWAAPIAMAGGVPWPAAVALAVILGAVFASAIVSVRGLIFANKPMADRARLRRLGVGCGLGGAVVAGVAALIGGLGPVGVLASLPVPLLSAAFAIGQPHPRALRRLGWVTTVAAVGTLGGLAFALR